MKKRRITKQKEVKVSGVKNAIIEILDNGKKKIICPECLKEVTQNIAAVDYGVRKDGALFFIKKCVDCNIGVKYFTSPDCKIFYANEKDIPVLEVSTAILDVPVSEREVSSSPEEIPITENEKVGEECVEEPAGDSYADKLIENLQKFIEKMEKQREERLAREAKENKKKGKKKFKLKM